MQKKYAFFLVLLAVWGCNQNDAAQRTATAEEDFALQFENELDTAWNETAQDRLSTAVPLPPGRTPLQVYNRQLTDRAAEEQIVIARHPELGNLELFLISGRVVSSVEGSIADYRIVAKQELQIDSETFTLQTQDLTGDGVTQEIFISGEDTQSGLEHVYVFTLLVRGADENIAGLRRIFTQQGEGSYQVSYDGRRYYIVYQRLLDADSGQLELSQLYWSRASRAFIVRNTERIQNNAELPANLKAAYQGSPQDFFMAIDGLWKKTDSEVPSQQQDFNNLFIHFDAPARELVIYGDLIGLGKNQQVMEIYDISGISKSLWNRINLNIRNKYVYNIQNSFYITLKDWNTIQLFLMEGSNYAGTYQRIDRENFGSYQDEKVLGPPQFRLEGVFREQSRIYTFQPDKLRIDEQSDESGGQIWEGAYSLYSWNGYNYLEIHVTETQNFTEYYRSYRVEPINDQNEKNNQTQREMEEQAAAPSVVLLHPVRLLQGEEVADTSQSIIRLEREQLPEASQISLNTEPDEGSILETTK